MKKTVYQAIAALAIIASFTACNQEVLTPDPETLTPDASKKQVTITVSIPENIKDVTKVDITQDPSNPKGNVKLSWKDTDVITVKNHDGDDQETFSIASISDNGTATFTGNAVPGEKFDILYSNLPEGFSVQNQAGNATTDHLGWGASLIGVNTYDKIIFSADWASSHGGGTFSQSSILRLRAKLPSEKASHITGVTIKALDADYNKVNLIDAATPEITVNFAAGSGLENDVVAVYVSLPAQEIVLPAGNGLLFSFVSDEPDHTVYTHYRPITEAITMAQGSLTPLNINCPNVASFAGVSDDGSEAHPYLIGDKYQLDAMHGLMAAGATKYFKLIDDIDMSGISWTLLNEPSPYNKLVDFDGNYKTITNLGGTMFYVFKGSVKNLTLDNPSVSGGSQKGVFAQYIQGTDNYLTNVDISNVTEFTPSTGNCGGLIGRINSGTSGQTTATISDCDITNTPVNGACVGGLLGSVEAKVIVTNCSFSGNTVTGTTQNIGGLVGKTGNNIACSFTGCRVEDAVIDASTIAGDARVGGFIGLLGEGCFVYGCTVGTAGQKVTVKAGTISEGEPKPVNTGGFVGVNYGTITKDSEDNHSKAYVTVTSTNTTGNQLNLGGFAGYQRGTITYSDAIVSMGDLQGQYIGGFCGYIVFQTGKTVLTDHCTVCGDGDPETVDIKGNNYTGGFVGVAESGDFVITNCHVLEGTVVVGQSTAGGFAAQIKSGTVENCSATVDMQCRGGNDGGFVGAITGGTIQNCTSAGTLSLISGSNNVFGGFAGYLNGVNLKKCSSTVDITVARSYVGGLIGDLQTANTISECFYNGTISGPYNYKGGLIGVTQAVAAVITNCYTAGELVGSSSTQLYGGIVGELKSGASVTNCYSTMNMAHGGRAMGGIVGRACNAAWDVSAQTGNTVSKCIAWNPAITFDGNPNTSASSGAVIGYTSFKNTLNNCYRRYDMTYKNSNTAVGTTCQTSMVDQIDCDGTNWGINGTRPSGTAPAGTSADAQYQAPYYGVAAASNATVSSIAQTLGWSADIWDFSGDYPTLK